MTQFLILHKVRGSPSFDIADKAMYGDEEGWSLCTCGHRAYPISFWELDSMRTPSGLTLKDEAVLPPEWDGWPEHYAQHPEPKLKLNVLELVNSMLPKLKRRI